MQNTGRRPRVPSPALGHLHGAYSGTGRWDRTALLSRSKDNIWNVFELRATGEGGLAEKRGKANLDFRAQMFGI